MTQNHDPAKTIGALDLGQRRLPSLMALRAFEAAARHESFSRAAEELRLTQSAVSRHIRHLEDDLGMRLFWREGPRVGLTGEGADLRDIACRAFAQLSEGISAMHRSRRKSLVISMLPSVAARWFAPRIGDFAALHPQVEVILHCARSLVDFERDGIDMAIRYGTGRWPKCRVEPLGQEELHVVCAPQRMADLGHSPSPDRLLRAKLLHGDNPGTWADWFHAASVNGSPALQGPTISDDNALLEAAASGQGFALARSWLTKTDIAVGRLISPFDIRLPARFSYWIVTPEGRIDPPTVVAMRAFIHGLVAEPPTRFPQPDTRQT